MKHTCASISVLLVFVFCSVTAPVHAGVPSGFNESEIISGLSRPTAFAIAPDGRIFVTQQSGDVRLITGGTGDNPQLQSSDFHSVSTSSSGEQGLLGIALDPSFSSNNYIYLYHTTTGSPKRSRIVRITAGSTSASGQTTIFETDSMDRSTRHHGGGIEFGTDGKLYIGVGDNTSSSTSQDRNSHPGTLLRINKDGSTPSDNPFGNEVWAYGLRNPFTLGIDPSNGTIYVNDVGQSSYEEVNRITKGGNYGWPDCEGRCSDSSYENPIHTYRPSLGRAITGGAVYRGSAFPSEYNGRYFFGDYSSDWIRMLTPGSNSVSVFADNIDGPVDLDVGPDGALYSLSYNGGSITRIRYGTSIPPTATPDIPDPTSIPPTSTPSTGCGAVGDIDCSGEVNIFDLSTLLRNFGTTNAEGDLDGSGEVNIFDLSTLLRNFGA